MMNRITTAIARQAAQVENRIINGLVTAENVEETRKDLDFSFDEYIKFQELKSLAYASGKLSQDEAMTIFNYLGESGVKKFNDQPIEVKAVLTQIFGELLRKKIAS